MPKSRNRRKNGTIVAGSAEMKKSNKEAAAINQEASLNNQLKVDIANIKVMIDNALLTIDINISRGKEYLSIISSTPIVTGRISPETTTNIIGNVGRLEVLRSNIVNLRNNLVSLESTSVSNPTEAFEAILKFSESFGAIQSELGSIKETLSDISNKVDVSTV